ncbi:MAG: LacI family DNA-binding transcriptional regulator [Thermaerobacter sp.]|nr:LacI family DNA-binding transcriptional regulator [Thermaerobacter sp.]
MSLKMTSRDIAQKAGVSQSTVSRVLRGDPRVRDAARQAVLAVLDATGYTPNRLARSMRGIPMDVVGVVVDNLANPFYQKLLNSLSEEVSRRQQRLMVWVGADMGDRAAIEAINEHLVDGLVFTAATPAVLETATSAKVPLVLLNRTAPHLAVDQVCTNNEAAAYDLARYVTRHGRRRIMLVGGPAEASTAAERLRGFRRGCEEGGAAEVTTVNGQFSYDVAHQATTAFLAQEPRPDTVLAVADLMAFAVLDAARAQGMRVPDDLWVVGFNGVEMASWASYDLTTAIQPLDGMVSAAVDLLLRRIAEPDREPTRRRMDAPVVIRGSTAHAPWT